MFFFSKSPVFMIKSCSTNIVREKQMMPSLPETDMAYKTGTTTESWCFVFLNRKSAAASSTCTFKKIGTRRRRRRKKKEQTGTSPNKWDQWVQFGTQIKGTNSCLY